MVTLFLCLFPITLVCPSRPFPHHFHAPSSPPTSSSHLRTWHIMEDEVEGVRRQRRRGERVKVERRKRSAGEVNRYRRSRGHSVNLSASLSSKSTSFSWLLISVRLSVCVSLSASNLPPTVPRDDLFCTSRQILDRTLPPLIC